MTAPAARLRVFLDAGVILDGCFSSWGSSKGVLILATAQRNLTIVLAEAIEQEVRDGVARRIAPLAPTSARPVSESVQGWLARAQIERRPLPSSEELRAHAARIMPAIRHRNDLPAVVTAILARPDWTLSTNTRHWNPELTNRTGLRVATPLAFLQQLWPRPAS